MRSLGAFNPLAGGRVPLRAVIRGALYRGVEYAIEREVISDRGVATVRHALYRAIEGKFNT